LNKIRLTVQDTIAVADLWDTPTAQIISQNLPIEGIVNTWGEEIYFQIPLTIELEPGARSEVEVGEIGYWPTGSAFCIFFGPTPMSQGQNPVAASDVNVFGKVVGDCSVFTSVPRGTYITVALA
jgi:hypothetical protein